MNKEFEYKGYKFNIEVDLNTSIERSLEGKRWSTIIINNMNYGNFYKKIEVLNSNIETTIVNIETSAKKYVDDALFDSKSPEEKMLIKLGFK